MTAATVPNAASQQDNLRPLRQFVSVLSGAMGDQTWAGTDAYATNPSGQFISQGPNGVTVEGQPITTTLGGGVALSPVVVMLGIGAVIAYLLLK